MWGQGLLPADKFVQKICDWLATQRHEGVCFEPVLTSYAHSGATARATRRDQSPPLWGEIPEPAPSIGAQLEHAIADSATGQGVDLVLLNGGINDISAFGVVVGNPYDANGVEVVVSETRTKLTCFMVPLIERALAAFPHANIVVLGYYPVISRRTDARQLARLIKHLPRVPGAPNLFDEFFEHLPDDAIESTIALEKDRMVEQSAAFAEAARTVFSTTVASLSTTRRVFYADVDFDERNSFATTEGSWLWGGNDDPMHGERIAKYAEQLQRRPLAPLDWPLYTPIASLCHPNERGSAAYAECIREILQKVPVLYWRAARESTQPNAEARATGLRVG